MAIKPSVIAQQLCLLNHRLMRQVEPTEVLTAVWRTWSSEEEKAEELPNLNYFIDRFNKVRRRHGARGR